jgi:hypothetical protein
MKTCGITTLGSGNGKRGQGKVVTAGAATTRLLMLICYVSEARLRPSRLSLPLGCRYAVVGLGNRPLLAENPSSMDRRIPRPGFCRRRESKRSAAAFNIV